MKSADLVETLRDIVSIDPHRVWKRTEEKGYTAYYCNSEGQPTKLVDDMEPTKLAAILDKLRRKSAKFCFISLRTGRTITSEDLAQGPESLHELLLLLKNPDHTIVIVTTPTRTDK